jgi:hypothetical protein
VSFDFGQGSTSDTTTWNTTCDKRPCSTTWQDAMSVFSHNMRKGIIMLGEWECPLCGYAEWYYYDYTGPNGPVCPDCDCTMELEEGGDYVENQCVVAV